MSCDQSGCFGPKKHHLLAQPLEASRPGGRRWPHPVPEQPHDKHQSVVVRPETRISCHPLQYRRLRMMQFSAFCLQFSLLPSLGVEESWDSQFSALYCFSEPSLCQWRRPMSCASVFLTIVPALQHGVCSGDQLCHPMPNGAPALHGTSPHAPGGH